MDAVLTGLVFIYNSVANGVSSALNKLALNYYNSPPFVMGLRVLAAFIGIILIMLIIALISKTFREAILRDLKLGYEYFFKFNLLGLLSSALPNLLITFAQKWVGSAATQLLLSLSTPVCAIFSHFFLPDESLTLKKVLSLSCSLVGVVLITIPSFIHPEGSSSTKEVVVGIILILISVICSGYSSVYYKLLKVDANPVFVSFWEILGSTMVIWIFLLVYERPSAIKTLFKTKPYIGLLYPVLLGVFTTALGMVTSVYLVKKIGAVRNEYTHFLQLVIAVIVGLAFFSEWKGYATWEYAISIIGLILILGGILIEFKKEKPKGYEEVELNNLTPTSF